MSKCSLCGEPMPPGEEMFMYHGYSGPCPKPPLEPIVVSRCCPTCDALTAEVAVLRKRLAEIIGYCAQEGRDGEPYDTINAIATGEYSTRGGGKP